MSDVVRFCRSRNDGRRRLAEHDSAPADEGDAEIAARREWFNQSPG